MALIVPDSTVALYRGVEITDHEQLWFASKAEQDAYFAKHLITSKAACTYIRRTGRLRIEWPTSQVSQANYIVFQNPSFENKKFYARITDYEYVNNVTTDIRYVIDAWQTECFTAKYDTMLIEREHVTETEYQNAVANPYRDDIPELKSEEPLAVGKLLETNYVNDIPAYTGDEGAGYQGYWPVSGADTKNMIVMELAVTGGDEAVTALKQVLQDNASGYDDKVMRDNFVKAFVLVWIDVEEKPNGMRVILDYLTANSLSHNIVGFFAMPKYMFEGYESPSGSGITYSNSLQNEPGKNNDLYTLGVTPPTMVNVDPKLHRFPYSYLRLISPSSDVKEFYYEHFVDTVANKNAICYFKAITNINGLPSIYMCPYRYKYSTPKEDPESIIPYNWRADINRDESLDFTGFPQASFVTDGYLAFLASVYNNALAAKSVPARANRVLDVVGTIGNVATRAATGVAQSALTGSPVPLISSVAGSALENAGAITQQIMTQRQIDEATRARTSGDARQIYSNLYNDASAAYIADDYHPGSGTGHKPYQLAELRYLFQTVKLRDDVLAKYTRFFNYFGYASKRIGVPHICDALNGGAAPHFADIDGIKGTYLKTSNAHVIASNADFSADIENLFNGGCRFLKGSEL